MNGLSLSGKIMFIPVAKLQFGNRILKFINALSDNSDFKISNTDTSVKFHFSHYIG